MGIFDGLGGADPTQGRAPFLTPGTYLVEVTACRGGKSKKKKPFFAVDMQIRDVIDTYIASEDEQGVAPTLYREKVPVENFERPVGPATWYVSLGGDWPELALGNVKAFLMAAVAAANGSEDVAAYADDVDADTANDAIAGEGDALAGVYLVARAENRTTQTGRPFTVTTFAPGNVAAGERGMV